MPDSKLNGEKKLTPMIIKKILNNLKEIFKIADPNKKYNNKMAKVLSKLQAKALNLEVQLENEKNKEKRKEINLMLKVISKQIKKGEKLMQEREKKPHSSKKHQFVIRPKLSPPIL